MGRSRQRRRTRPRAATFGSGSVASVELSDCSSSSATTSSTNRRTAARSWEGSIPRRRTSSRTSSSTASTPLTGPRLGLLTDPRWAGVDNIASKLWCDSCSIAAGERLSSPDRLLRLSTASVARRGAFSAPRGSCGLPGTDGHGPWRVGRQHRLGPRPRTSSPPFPPGRITNGQRRPQPTGRSGT